MMVAVKNAGLNFWQTLTTQVVPVLLTLAISGTVYAIIQIATIQTRLLEHDHSVARIDARNEQQDKRFEDLIATGSRQIPALELRVHNLEETVTARTTIIEKMMQGQTQLTPLEQSEFSNIRKMLDRLEERDNRIVQALDATYALLNEHIRAAGHAQGAPPKPAEPLPIVPPMLKEQ